MANPPHAGLPEGQSARIGDEALWFRAVYCLLRSRYAPSRRKHLVSFLPSSPCFADRKLDGKGGSAILTELQGSFGKEVLLRRDFFKQLVLISARELGYPLYRLPSGSVSVGFRPSSRACSSLLLDRVLSQLPLPSEARAGTLADLLGEAWWGVSSAEGLPAARTLGCYTATVPSPKRLLRTIFCFPCTRLRLSNGATIHGEWRRGGAFLSLRTSDVWDFVHFLRYQRRKENLRSEVMEIGGLGDVLV